MLPQPSSLQSAGRLPGRPMAIPLVVATLILALASAADAALEEPCSGSDDWVQVASSEWLKGNMRRMRYGNMDFWSREVKSRKIRWRKVIVLCMAHEARFVTRGYMVFTGVGVVREGTVTVETAEGKVSFPREDLTAILLGRGSELDRWGIMLGVGIDANIGNTEQTSVNLSGGIRREDRFSRSQLVYEGTYGTANGQENLNRHRIEGSVKWFFSRRLYWSILDAPVVNDKFQNIAIRVAPATSIGLQVFDRAGLGWSLEAGAGYQYIRYLSVQPPQELDSNDAVARFSTDFNIDLVSNLEFNLSHSTTVIPTDLGLTTLYTRASIKYELTWLLKLETAIVHNRIFQPVPRADGTRPQPDDLQLIVGFTFDSF